MVMPETLSALLSRPKSLYFAGAFHAAIAPERLEIVNPSTGESFATIDAGGAEDMPLAVSAATAAFPGWRDTSGAERAKFLRGIAVGLEARRNALVALQMLNNGKPRFEADIDVSDAIATFTYYAGLAEELDADQGASVALADPGYAGATRQEPLGPVGLIVPWNFPLVTSAWKLAPALAAGCTVVLKTSEFTPFAELAYADIAEEIGLPRGVLNIITGAETAGRALVADRRLRKISFTGSNTVGAQVMAEAAKRVTPVSLELGGKSAILVFGDADIDHAVECILAGVFFNAGQMCSATSRLLVDESLRAALVSKLVERTAALVVGNGEDSQMGPISTRRQYERVLGWLSRAANDGLTPATGGKPKGAGFFVEPTIYLDVPVDHPLWREEVFGPVLAMRTFTSEDEAVALANDSDYGLVATIVTADPTRAERVAGQLEAGHIWINSIQLIFPNSSWGGFKQSGIGRELGPAGLGAFLGSKFITRPVG
jgi:betaine-aldehyde dehydrogenase